MSQSLGCSYILTLCTVGEVHVAASQKRLAFAGMNPDLLADSRTDLRFDAFNETHANPAEFIGWPDRGGNFQRGLFYLAPAKMWSCVDAFECVRHFSCFHNLLSWLRR